MAMNKAEKAELNRALREAAMAKALRFPTDPKPRPMTVAEIKAALGSGGIKFGRCESVARGWFGDCYSLQVTHGCSNGHTHSKNSDTTNTQSHGCMYRTKAEAWRAIRHEKVLEVATILAKIDEAIEAAEAEELREAQAKVGGRHD